MAIALKCFYRCSSREKHLIQNPPAHANERRRIQLARKAYERLLKVISKDSARIKKMLSLKNMIDLRGTTSIANEALRMESALSGAFKKHYMQME